MSEEGNTTNALALLGWVGALLSCLMPIWHVTAFIGTTICKPYESTLMLGTDLQAARALTVMSILLGTVGLVLAFIGGKCTIFMDQSKRFKARIATAAGVTLIVAGVLCLIPVSWSAGIVVKAEIGGAIYVGWGPSIVLILGGGMLCTTICKDKTEDDCGRSVKYLMVSSLQAGSSRAGSQRMQPVSVRSLQSGTPSV
uniref:Zgc:136892 n=1 Tax=Sinocyclocheilus grahami TaxID=75366 RepID=A0A672K9Y4_SINGR